MDSSQKEQYGERLSERESKFLSFFSLSLTLLSVTISLYFLLSLSLLLFYTFPSNLFSRAPSLSVSPLLLSLSLYSSLSLPLCLSLSLPLCLSLSLPLCLSLCLSVS